jgi:hypothetical protein
LGRRFCWSGLELVDNHPEPTRRMPMRHDTKNTGGGTSDVSQLAGQTGNAAICTVYWSVVAAWCSAAVAPPPVVVGGEGVHQADNEGRAELGDGVVAPSISLSEDTRNFG